MLPNFLLIGAAKSGTSSVFAYLGQHPDVFVSPAKEPNYFALADERVAYAGPGDSIVNQTSITNLEDYETLFRSADRATAIGEASTLYLYAAGAAAAIHRQLPGVRVIAILREPAERAYSSFLHMRRDGREVLPSFEDALREEENRIRANWEHLWHYTRLGYYHEQLQRYFGLFPREQLAVWLYDELQTDPRRVLREMFTFLGVDPSFEPDMSVKHKVAGIPRSNALHAALTQPNLAKTLAKRLLPASLRGRLYGAMMQKNIVPHREDLRSDTRRRLQALYSVDVARLSTLLDRDLSAWLPQASTSRL
ncbi:MAG: sulfotransferase [Gemmatimonadales bacterium]|nr:sulfotransferase [Gemmatimonadales bacterium]